MKQVILMSIRPEHLVKILNGEKTIEIRKTIPKCELPIEVYLYCTKSKKSAELDYFKWGQYELITDDNAHEYNANDVFWNGNGKVIAKFTLNKWNKMPYVDNSYEVNPHDIPLKANMTIQQINEYGNKKPLYAWHIDNLVIFDEPMELRRLYKCKLGNITKDIVDWYGDNEYKITNAPQSWQYVWVKGE